MSRAVALRRAARELARAVDPLEFGAPVSHVYNPLAYAWRAHAAYLERAGDAPKRIVYLGMNPGPFGMAQTGVPFGEVASVRDWLGIEAKIDRPAREHPKRPIQGFSCTRSEVSGARLWGAISAKYGTPEHFFAQAIVLNYCPLLFVETSGRNLTPDRVRKSEAAPLFAACDRHLQRAVAILQPEWVVGVGQFAAQRARSVLPAEVAQVGQILHPSPANPRANRGWAEQVNAQLVELGVCRAACRGSHRSSTLAGF